MLLFVVTGIRRDLVVVPNDVVAQEGDTVQFVCRPDESYLVNWAVTPVQDSLPTDVFYHGALDGAFSARHRVHRRIDGLFQLVIRDVTKSDAGKYTCLDHEGSGPERASAQLIVLGKMRSSTHVGLRMLLY